MSHRAHQEKTERTNSYGAGHCFSFSFTYLRGKGGREKKKERKKERQRGRGRERETDHESSCLLEHFSKCPQQLWLDRAEASRQELSRTPTWLAGPKHISQDMLPFWVQEVRIGSQSQDLTPRTDHRPLHPCLIFCTKPCRTHAPSLMSFK